MQRPTPKPAPYQVFAPTSWAHTRVEGDADHDRADRDARGTPAHPDASTGMSHSTRKVDGARPVRSEIPPAMAKAATVRATSRGVPRRLISATTSSRASSSPGGGSATAWPWGRAEPAPRSGAAGLGLRHGPLPGATLGRDLVHRLGQLGQRRALLHVTVGAQVERRLAERLAEEAREDHDARLGRTLRDPRDRLEPVHARHRQVADDDVRLQVLDQRQPVDRVVGLAHDLQRAFSRQRPADAQPQLAGVVEQEDAHDPGRGGCRHVPGVSRSVLVPSCCVMTCQSNAVLLMGDARVLLATSACRPLSVSPGRPTVSVGEHRHVERRDRRGLLERTARAASRRA